MKKLFVLFLVLPLCSFYPQSLEEVLQKYYKAVNQEKLSSVQTITMKGKILQGGIELPMSMYQKRPNKMRMEGSFSGMTFIQTYDGTTGWNLNPFMGATEPQPMKAEELKQAESQADIDGYLVNSEQKGYKLQLLPGADTSVVKAHVISITKPDSSVILLNIDPNTGYMVMQKAKANINNTEMEVETYFSDYKTVNDLVVPFKMENKVGGQTMLQIILEDVQLDADLPDSLFGKPEKKTN